MSRFVLTSYIIQKTKENLDNKGVDNLVPINRIINNKLIPNNEFLMLVNNFTGIIKVSTKPHNIHSCYIHGNGHYCTNINNHWCL